MEPKKEVKIAIIKQELTALGQAIYQQVIRHTVCKKVNDEKGMEACKKAMEDMEARKLAYEEQLESVEKE